MNHWNWNSQTLSWNTYLLKYSDNSIKKLCLLTLTEGTIWFGVTLTKGITTTCINASIQVYMNIYIYLKSVQFSKRSQDDEHARKVEINIFLLLRVTFIFPAFFSCKLLSNFYFFKSPKIIQIKPQKNWSKPVDVCNQQHKDASRQIRELCAYK